MPENKCKLIVSHGYEVTENALGKIFDGPFCPECITITDNAIIPLKERVVDKYYDPFGWLWKKLRPKV